MNYKNAYVFADDFCFHHGGFSVENGKFENVLSEEDDAIDLCGAYVIPGLIDVHTHGNSGADFSDGLFDGDLKMAAYLASVGVTAFTPATMTLPYHVISEALKAGRRLRDAEPFVFGNISILAGAQMEGPFFSEKKKGAQNAEYLRLPDKEAFDKLFFESDGMIKIADIAPELDGSELFISETKEKCTVSVAHTDANYEEARLAFAAGATHLTHLFNAMPPIHHRNPGVIGAAAECGNVTAEIICDGIHVHPSAVRMAFRIFGSERICLISDSLRCCGMPDGEYELGGQSVFLKNRVARLSDGTIAGSATNLYDCMLNAVSFGISKEDAIRAATYNPAREIRELDKMGSISNGKLANFVICDDSLIRKRVYIYGVPVN